jgi:glucose/arabinose dehydrogenase
LLALWLPLILVAGCGDDTRLSSGASVPGDQTSSAPTSANQLTPAPQVDGLTLPAGFRAEVYAKGLQSPTALAFGPEGKLYLTQLNGGENAGSGQVVRLDGPGSAPVVVLDRLLKPTGLAWTGKNLYLAAARDVLRTTLDADGKLAQPAKSVENLPFNGRSEGQIDLLPDGRLLFEAAGQIGDPDSARLFTLAPGGKPEPLATGLKNAYAHAVDPATGRIFSTEIGDDTMDGKAPPEEINLIQSGAAYGWPRCYAERIPAADRGGTAAICAGTQPPLVTFPPHATPTGLAFYDRDDFPADYRGALYAAVFNADPPVVVRVTLRESAGRLSGSATPFIGGLKRPIDLLPDPKGGLLVLDFETGTLYRITAD